MISVTPKESFLYKVFKWFFNVSSYQKEKKKKSLAITELVWARIYSPIILITDAEICKIIYIIYNNIYI